MCGAGAGEYPGSADESYRAEPHAAKRLAAVLNRVVDDMSQVWTLKDDARPQANAPKKKKPPGSLLV